MGLIVAVSNHLKFLPMLRIKSEDSITYLKFYRLTFPSAFAAGR